MSRNETHGYDIVPHPLTGAGPRGRSKGVLNLNKQWERFIVSAAAAACILGAAATAQGQVAGLVNEFGGSPLQGAKVEVWDAYPSGSILTSGTSGANGTFSLPDPGVGTFDLRVTGDGYYPTVIRDLPEPIGNVIATLTALEAVATSPSVEDCSDEASTFLGTLIQPGDVVEAIAAGNTHAGMTQYIPAPGLYLLHIQGGSGGAHPLPGEEVSFLINGLAASPSLNFAPFSSVDHQLTGAANAPGVTVIGPADLSGHTGSEVLASYIITNTGSVAGTFSFDVSIDSTDWVIQVIGSSPVALNAGQSAQIDVLITAPAWVPAIVANLTMMVTSDTYDPANCGSTTAIDAQATDVNDDIGGGSLVPSQFSLAQNYPNPFNPETMISFNILEAGNARLEVFNILGQSVDVLIDGFMPAGPVSTEWNGRDRNGTNVPSGIYFYRLSRGGEALTRQMVLLR